MSAGPPTFLGLPEEDSTFERASVLVLPIPYEGTVTYGSGTARGPAAILDASRQVETWDEESSPIEDGETSDGRREERPPYRFLDYYTEDDADLFFGRGAAARDLGERVLAERARLGCSVNPFDLPPGSIRAV